MNFFRAASSLELRLVAREQGPSLMTAFATTNQANLRYWTLSAGIVLLVHGAIATAVLSWRNATAPAGRPRPGGIQPSPMPPPPPPQPTPPPPPPTPGPPPPPPP